MSIKQNLDNYLKNLNFQIQVESMGLNSWGDVKKREANRQFELPSSDTLLNNKKELENKQLARQQQIQLYLEKEKRPVIVNGVEYKYNQLPEPPLYNINDYNLEVQKSITELTNELSLYNNLANNLKKIHNDILQVNINIKLLEKEKNKFIVDLQNLNDKLTQLQIDNINIDNRKNEIKQNITNINKEITTKLELLSKTDKTTEEQRYIQLEEEIKDLQDKENELKNEQTNIKNNKKNIENDIKNIQNDIPIIDGQIKNVENDIQTLKNIDLPGLNQDKADIENRLKITEIEIDNKKNQSENATNELKKAERENKKMSDEYASELKRVNIGSFNVERLPNETDNEYIERLTINSQIPFDNSTVKTLSDIERNNLFKDNLKLLFQSDSFIEKILNYYKTTNDHYIFIMNQYFNLFKDDYLKVYGFNNKSILDDPETFIEIVDNFCRAGDDGKPELITPSKDIESKQKYSALEPVLSKLSKIERFVNPLQSLTYQEQMDELLKLEQLPMKTPEEEKKMELIQEILEPSELLKQKINNFFDGFTDNNNNVLILKDPENPPNKRFLMYINTDVNEANEYDDAGNPINTVKFKFTKKQPILLISQTGQPGTFEELSTRKAEKSNIYKNLFIDFLKLTNKEVKKIFNISNVDIIPKEEIQKIINLLGLQPTILTKTPILKNPKAPRVKEYPIIGYGLKEETPEYIQFGKFILLLKKLKLKNILSLHKQNHQKIPGFKNYNVSNEFVNLIMKIINKENITPQDLAILKIGEKELLDTLLTLCELNKKIITGSGSETLQKVKEQLKLIEGQIEAGNNNPLLKEELYKTLFKLVSFGAITEKQARTHYKNICADFFI